MPRPYTLCHRMGCTETPKRRTDEAKAEDQSERNSCICGYDALDEGHGRNVLELDVNASVM